MSSHKKLKMCILCASDPTADPRPNRLIEYFKDSYDISVIALNPQPLDGVELLVYKNPPKRSTIQELQLYFNVFFKRYIKLVKIPSRVIIGEYLSQRNFDIIISHDLILLPFVIENKKNAKVIFDAREYYPKQQEENFRWKVLFSKFNDWLCKSYLKEVDYIYTVSKGLAKEYAKNYSVECDVVYSFTNFYHKNQISVNDKKIKMIYHGAADKNRSIHLMIEMMNFVDSRFTLDLMLVNKGSPYYKKLVEMARECKNIKIIDAVRFNEIVPFTSSYDIGLYLLPPTSFNTKHALPNKFFEFIQARLAIAIGPSIEMAEIVRKNNLGVVSNNFEPKSLAISLNKLTTEDILKYKRNSDRVAKKFSNSQSMRQIEKILNDVIASKISIT